MHIQVIRRIQFILSFLVFTCFIIHTQTPINTIIITKGDSIEISVPAFRGVMYYETSYELGTWERRTEPVQPDQQLFPDTNKYYRLVILEGTCDPLYTDTFWVNVVHAPYVLTLSANEITQVSASIQVILLDSGELIINRKGVCWNNAPLPIIEDDMIENQESSATFVCVLTGLNPGTVYYIRAFAENEMGISYGNEIHLTTLTDQNLPVVELVDVGYISPVTANITGEVLSDGGVAVYDRGFCLDTLPNPDISSIIILHSGYGTGIFDGFVMGLLPGTTYYVKAFAVNNAGISYSNDTTFTTKYIKTIPTISTIGIDSVTCSEIFVSYAVLNDGFDSVLARGVCWDTLPMPTIYSDTTNDGGGIGSFVSYIDNIEAVTTYFVRAYATNSIGTGYGLQFEVTTDICRYPPVVIAMGVSGITTESAIISGQVVSDGNDFVFERGFCWDTLPDPGLSDNTLNAGSDTGVFEAVISGLDSHSEYFFKAYAINGIDTAYSNEISFTTLNISDSLMDERDGQVYNIVQICEQWWMAENLNYRTSTGSYYYNDDSLTYSGYGRLYTWYAATALLAVTQTCPAGWHLPSDDEWKELEMCLGMTQAEADALDWRGTDQGTKLKIGGNSGFDALLGGRRTSGATPTYLGMEVFGYYWSATDNPGSADAYDRTFSFSKPGVERNFFSKKNAFYVRCVKDSE